MLTNTIISPTLFINTNVFIEHQVPILKHTGGPDVSLAILLTLGVLILIKLISMAYYMYLIQASKNAYRKMMLEREKLLYTGTLKERYLKLRAQHNKKQMEFDFVKEIDSNYIENKYKLKL